MEVFGTRVQDLLAYLHRHREDEIKQEWGCMALMIMCQDNTENRRIAGEQGAIQAVVDALNRHRGNKEVQANGHMALASMCINNTENRRIVDAYGQTVILHDLHSRDQSVESLFPCNILYL